MRRWHSGLIDPDYFLGGARSRSIASAAPTAIDRGFGEPARLLHWRRRPTASSASSNVNMANAMRAILTVNRATTRASSYWCPSAARAACSPRQIARECNIPRVVVPATRERCPPHSALLRARLALHGRPDRRRGPSRRPRRTSKPRTTGLQARVDEWFTFGRVPAATREVVRAADMSTPARCIGVAIRLPTRRSTSAQAAPREQFIATTGGVRLRDRGRRPSPGDQHAGQGHRPPRLRGRTPSARWSRRRRAGPARSSAGHCIRRKVDVRATTPRGGAPARASSRSPAEHLGPGRRTIARGVRRLCHRLPAPPIHEDDR